MEIEFSKKYRYRLMENTEIQTSGSTIYQAQDLNLGRNVCVKKITLQGENSRETDLNLDKALNEARAMVAVSELTARVPDIFDTYYDRITNNLYIIMQWIQGNSLRNYMDVSEHQFIKWMLDLTDILSMMEQKNLYHKDIKPENIMIDKRNELFLIDFNISVSTPNLVEGTINYKAPEMEMKTKYMGRDKVDMFAVGVMLYEYYTGSVPRKSVDYARNSTMGNFEWDVFVEPKEKNTKIPDKINEIIVTCMKLDVKQRYRNNNELKYALREAERSLRYEKRTGNFEKTFRR